MNFKKLSFVKLAKLILLVFILLLLLFFIVALIWPTQIQNLVYSSRLNSKKNLPIENVYHQYQFNREPGVIHIGIQPLYLPTNMIMQVVQHDMILRRQLNSIGMKIKFYPFVKGSDVNYFLSKNRLDAGVGGDMPALIAATNYKAVITCKLQEGFSAIVSNFVGPVELLKSKRIGYAKDSNAFYALLKILHENHLSLKDVKLISGDVSDFPQALKQNRVDAFAAWEPTPTLTLTTDQQATIIYRYLNTGYLYFTKSFFLQHKQAVLYINAAIIRAINWMQSDYKNLLIAASWSQQAEEKFSHKKSLITVSQLSTLAVKDIIGVNRGYMLNEQTFNTLKQEFVFLQQINILTNSVWSDVQSRFNRKIVDQIEKKYDQYQLNQFQYKYNVGDNLEVS